MGLIDHPTPLPLGAAYATVADIRDCAQLPELPVTPGYTRVDTGAWEPIWTRPDGSALTILVRALTFTERREVNQTSGESDDQFALETCLRGIKEPAFSREQIGVLEAAHPAAIDQIAQTIWSLCDLPAGMVTRRVRELAGLPATPRPKPRGRRVGRGVDPKAEPAVQPSDP